MASTTVKGSGSTVNNGGTVVNGGNLASDSPFTKNITINDLADGREDYGSKVVSQNGASGDYAGVTTANSSTAGGLAYYPDAQAGERNFLFKGAGDTSGKINNTASTVMSLPASEVGIRTVNKVHKVVKVNKLGAYADAEFNMLARPSADMVPGRTKGTGAGGVANFQQITSTSNASDDAASATRSVPGELTYMFGSIVPKQDDYKAKDAYEV